MFSALLRLARRASSTSPIFRSFNPSAGQFRELDGIAAVIIGGGSIFGGYGTIIGSLAGAAVITLIRALLSLQIITADGSSFVMPQHWVNVFIGLILIVAVLIDIWLRQADILGAAARRLRAAAASQRSRTCLTHAATPIVEMRGISKAFGAVRALRRRRPARSIRARSSASSATTRPASRR